MKKNLIWIGIIAVIVVLIGTLIGIHFWFDQPGIQVLGNRIHVELNEIGYIIDGETGEIVGQTPVSIDGSTSKQDKKLFNGDMTVLGYQNMASGTISKTMGIEKTEFGFFVIDHIETCTHSETVDGITENVEHFCDYIYAYYLYPENENFLVVEVEDFEEATSIFVVCADSEQQALEDYNWFLENRPA